MGVTSGAGISTFPEHPSSTPVFSGIRIVRTLVLCACFVDHCLPLSPVTASDYPLVYSYSSLIYLYLIRLGDTPFGGVAIRKTQSEKLRAERVCKLENEDKRLHFFVIFQYQYSF
jgi:hypothetical protein